MSKLTGKYLVTGGTGFLGFHIVSQLLEEGVEVLVLAKNKDKSLEDLGAKVIEGSILDENILNEVSRNVKGIFHLAGIVEHSRRQTTIMYDVNVVGTLRVLNAASRNKVKRVVYASASGVVGVSTDSKYTANDNSPYALETVKDWPYYNSKIAAEKQAKEYAQQFGIDLVILRPATLYGPGDKRLTSALTIKDYLEGKLPFIADGGISYVDVRDAAKAFRAAMLKAPANSCYLLGGTNELLENFYHRLELISGVRKPKLKVPNLVTWSSAQLVYFFTNTLFGKWLPGMDPVVIEMSQHYWYIDSTNARNALHFEPRDPEETLRDTVLWLQANFPSTIPKDPSAAIASNNNAHYSANAGNIKISGPDPNTFHQVSRGTTEVENS